MKYVLGLFSLYYYCFLAFFGFGILHVSHAAPIINTVSWGETKVTLLFEDDGSSNRFEVERTPGTNPLNWSKDNSAVLADLGNNQYSFSLDRNAADREFYRLVGSFLGSGPDPDGDGLPTVLEDSLGTTSTDSDTDDDGFSDGFEYASGTDPLDENDFPQNSTLPRISFVEANSTVTEGDGTISLALETDEGEPYNGAVQFAVSAISTASNGIDYVLGTTTMSGTNGVLNISLTDNAILSSELRVLNLEIQEVGGSYVRGGNFDTTVILRDNDCFWSGVLREGFCEVNFRARLIVENGIPEFAFVGGVQHDGLPSDTATGTDQSSGIIPTGVFTAVNNVYTAAEVSFTSSPIPVGEATLFGDNLNLTRTLTLSAIDANADGVVTSNAVGGTFTEVISDLSGSNPHLTVSKIGSFALAKQTQTLPTLPILFNN